MYLKSIRIDGFKSFAKKTIFEFNKGITAIVGPNGSGKSNIVDAVRWVLGEQSTKSLRSGSTMSDVIFSGSLTMDGLNKASVALTFDNSDKYLNSEYTEIEVRRCIYKTGESEYFINNQKVRLKDVEELFIDSGSSSKSFNIISQGTVTDLVNLKPLERRSIFESAAGVLKYKKRKEESIRKLEKTETNLESVNLLVNELSNSIEPLKSQSEIAEKYLNLKNELKEMEISLLVNDINDLNNSYHNLQQEEVTIKEKLEKTKKVANNEQVDKIKLELYKIDDEINDKNRKLLKLVEEIANISSEQRITEERLKLEYDSQKVNENLLNLKNEELSYSKKIELQNCEIDNLQERIKKKEKVQSEMSIKFDNLIGRKNILTSELNSNNLKQQKLVNKINILQTSIDNNERMPKSVQNILMNPRLKGIHNTLSELVEIPEEFLTCVDVILTSSANFLIVDNEESAKMAISYLKDNKLGRATFLPLNIIKPRYIDANTIAKISTHHGYVGIMSDLVSYDKSYKNIYENQLGNIIVVKNLDSMNEIAKITEYKYRVVTIDGDIIYSGGSISGGGAIKNSLGTIRKELSEYKKELLSVDSLINNQNKELDEIKIEEDKIIKELNPIKDELIELNTTKEAKLSILKDFEKQLLKVKNDIISMENITDNSLDATLENLLSRLNVLTIDKEKLEYTINTLKANKDELNGELHILEDEISKANSEYRKVASELNSVTLEIGKINAKLDSLLIYLNEEYTMTFEYAQENFVTLTDADLTRSKVTKMKKEIKSLGDVNTGSIEEYKRIKERYDFLVNQKNDLEVSIENLYAIIKDMDEIMAEKFKNTFDKIALEFTKVFKIMFQGGNGKLFLTDENDYLNTGIDIIVEPPGKKIHSTQSLSGGEKSLTAICLLFAILNVSPVPFIILDEVEAALDEVNVDLFGEYLNNKKNDSQYILITHKKRMMEYADVLYGITMQEAGISKVVGVKLENI